jgi:hypothetical protein
MHDETKTNLKYQKNQQTNKPTMLIHNQPSLTESYFFFFNLHSYRYYLYHLSTTNFYSIEYTNFINKSIKVYKDCYHLIYIRYYSCFY